MDFEFFRCAIATAIPSCTRGYESSCHRSMMKCAMFEECIISIIIIIIIIIITVAVSVLQYTSGVILWAQRWVHRCRLPGPQGSFPQLYFLWEFSPLLNVKCATGDFRGLLLQWHDTHIQHISFYSSTFKKYIYRNVQSQYWDQIIVYSTLTLSLTRCILIWPYVLGYCQRDTCIHTMMMIADSSW